MRLLILIAYDIPSRMYFLWQANFLFNRDCRYILFICKISYIVFKISNIYQIANIVYILGIKYNI